MATQPDPIRNWREQFARRCLNVTDLRLKHAFALLTAQGKGDVRICDVALQAGFSDISHFNRLFRSRFGDTPKGVRANQQTVSYAN